jgi:hypothetical protein
MGSAAEEQVSELLGGKTAALFLRDFPQELEIEFGGQRCPFAFEIAERIGDRVAVGAPIRMAHQYEIARNQSFVPAGIDDREMAFLFARDEGGLEPALIEVLDDSTGVFNR